MPRTLCLLGAVAFAGHAGAADLAGRIELLGVDKKTVPAVDAVVWVPGAPPAAPTAGRSIASKDKRFEPHVLVVPRRTTVVFPNQDRIFHNVFSLSPGSEFDLGLYRGGKSREYRFDTPGLVRVYCNIHAQMAAYVVVLDGHAFATTDGEGRFRIAGIPEGRREVRVWHERSGETSAFVEVLPGRPATLALVLDASARRDGFHKNKYGEDYPPATEDADRY